MRSPSGRRSLPAGRVDRLEVRVIDDPAGGAVDLGHALRVLARLLVRSYQADGDRQAITTGSESSPALTVAASPSPHHDENEAA